MDQRRGNQGGSYIAAANKWDQATVARMSPSEKLLTAQLLEAQNQRDIAIDRQEYAEAMLLRIAEDAGLVDIKERLKLRSAGPSGAKPQEPNEALADLVYLVGLVDGKSEVLRKRRAAAETSKPEGRL